MNLGILNCCWRKNDGLRKKFPGNVVVDCIFTKWLLMNQISENVARY